MALSFPNKDPEEVLDFSIDWSPRVGADTIVSSTWIIAEGGSGLTIEGPPHAPSFVPTQTTIWLSDGVLGTSYLLTNHIATAAGREMEQSVKLKIKAK